LLIRRAVALGVGVLVLILLVIGVRACQNSAKKNALRDYNRDVTALARDSDTQVSRPFFELMGRPGNRSPVDIETQVNQYRVVAEDLAERARDIGVRDEVREAHRNVILALDLRAGGLSKIADKVRTALGTGAEQEEAVEQIAGQMQAFLASDVLWSQRVVPLITEGLEEAEVTGQTVQSSRFLPDLSWLDPATVAERLGAESGGGTSGTGGPLAPGSHGHGLVSTTVGNLTLQPGGTVNRIPASGNPTFTVRFQNQGENDERDVVVNLAVTGAGRPIRVRRTVDQTTAGEESTVAIPLGQEPPVGTPVQITVSVAPVRGEETTDNNRSTYTAIFTR
jgi:hypothetical protein